MNNKDTNSNNQQFFDAEVVAKIISVILLSTLVTNMATTIYIKGLSDALIAQIVVWIALVFLLLNQWPLINQLKASKQENKELKDELEGLRSRIARLESAKK